MGIKYMDVWKFLQLDIQMDILISRLFTKR